MRSHIPGYGLVPAGAPTRRSAALPLLRSWAVCPECRQPVSETAVETVTTMCADTKTGRVSWEHRHAECAQKGKA